MITPSAQARALHRRRPKLTAAQIAKQLGMTRQNVENALKSAGRMGRPVGPDTVRVRLTLPAELYARLRGDSKRAGATLSQWAARLLGRRKG